MIEVVVTARTREAEGICSYELRCAQGRPLPAFSAGAHIDVHLPGGLVRQYSLCNHPQERHRYLIGVLNDAASRGGSRCLHEQVEAGQRLLISEPRNLFALAPSARRSLLFAGGIGITPILCMAEQLWLQGDHFELHYCARSSERAAFLQRLAATPFAGRVHLHFDALPQTRLDLAQVLAVPGAEDHLYVCGPAGFMQQVLDDARRQGWQDTQLHREYFAAAPVDNAGDGVFSVRLASTGQVFEIPADKTVVQVLQSHGVPMAVSCEQGVCGTCLTRVLEGVPEHRDLYLTEAEQAANDQFTPCCSRARTPMLVLDL
ncbi:PDR/VanB family oxidoreductase [Pseudomonas sp. SAR267]|jgi:vanillate O-demethylase ferredoxin subunit|uniref:PDR/VanB family oxidoreductase n=1 Tax=Pseudomonas TaxID=286 RepID=UPI0006D3B3B3|nr:MULTISPECIES: PDR/VanB family oxidoreductase [unclassified Pseudomonas]AXQ48538.1 oxidoreductase [Stenotrophomonas rhizophila]MBS3185681.1 oxidoreductase [Pseudomonas sp. PCH44]PIK80362.1 oxidoreductase [Pseudomonas sp. 382]